MFGHYPLAAPPQGEVSPLFTSQFVVNVLQNDSGYLHKAQDEGSEGQRPSVVPAGEGVRGSPRTPRLPGSHFPVPCPGLTGVCG